MGVDIQKKLEYFARSFKPVLDKTAKFVKTTNLFNKLEKKDDLAFKSLKTWLSDKIEFYIRSMQIRANDPSEKVKVELNDKFYTDMETDLERFLAHKQYKGNSISGNGNNRDYISTYKYRPDNECNFLRYLAQENRQLGDHRVREVRNDFDRLTKHKTQNNRFRQENQEENSTDSIKFLLADGVNKINEISGQYLIPTNQNKAAEKKDYSETASTVNSLSELSVNETENFKTDDFTHKETKRTRRNSEVIIPTKVDDHIIQKSRKSLDDMNAENRTVSHFSDNVFDKNSTTGNHKHDFDKTSIRKEDFKSKEQKEFDHADAGLIDALNLYNLVMNNDDRKQMLKNIAKDISGSFEKDMKLRKIHEKLNKSLGEYVERFEHLNKNWVSDQDLLRFLSYKCKINLVYKELIEEGVDISKRDVVIKDVYSFLLYAMQANNNFNLKECFIEIEKQLNNRDRIQEIKKPLDVLPEVVVAETIPLKEQPQIIKNSNRTIVQKEIAEVVKTLGKPKALNQQLVEQEIKNGKNVLNEIILGDDSEIRSALLNSIESSIMNEVRTNKILSKEKKYELARLVNIIRFFKNSTDADARAKVMIIYSSLLNYMDDQDIMFEDEMKNILIDAFVSSRELDPVVAEHIKLKPGHFYFEVGSLKSDDTPGTLNGRYNKCIFWTFAYARAVSGEIKKIKKQETEKKSYKDPIVENLYNELGIIEKPVIDVKTKQIDQEIEDMMKEAAAKIDEEEIFDKTELFPSVNEKIQNRINNIMTTTDPAEINRNNKDSSAKLDKDIFTHWVLSVYKTLKQLTPKDQIAKAIYNWLIKNTKMIYVDEKVKSNTIESYQQFLKILTTPGKKIAIKTK